MSPVTSGDGDGDVMGEIVDKYGVVFMFLEIEFKVLRSEELMRWPSERERRSKST